MRGKSELGQGCNHGATIIEIIVASAIFGVVGLVTVQLMNNISSSKVTASAKATAVAESAVLNRALQKDLMVAQDIAFGNNVNPAPFAWKGCNNWCTFASRNAVNNSSAATFSATCNNCNLPAPVTKGSFLSLGFNNDNNIIFYQTECVSKTGQGFVAGDAFGLTGCANANFGISCSSSQLPVVSRTYFINGTQVSKSYYPPAGGGLGSPAAMTMCFDLLDPTAPFLSVTIASSVLRVSDRVAQVYQSSAPAGIKNFANVLQMDP